VGAGETLPSGEHPAQSHAHPGPLVRVGLVEGDSTPIPTSHASILGKERATSDSHSSRSGSFLVSGSDP
jgi:hypothetical protein